MAHSTVTKPVTDGDWERLRPAIETLYVDEDRDLRGPDGVMAIMEQQYGFVQRCANVRGLAKLIMSVPTNTTLASVNGNVART